jgi:hypothetical protein
VLGPTHFWLFASHVPVRHCSESSHGPSPGAKPQLLSAGSQTSDTHTALPTIELQVATRSGSVGNGVPFSSLCVHIPVVSLHHWILEQSLSEVQPATHAPEVLSQTLPA